MEHPSGLIVKRQVDRSRGFVVLGIHSGDVQGAVGLEIASVLEVDYNAGVGRDNLGVESAGRILIPNAEFCSIWKPDLVQPTCLQLVAVHIPNKVAGSVAATSVKLGQTLGSNRSTTSVLLLDADPWDAIVNVSQIEAA
jgi:hypothetical protein